MNTPIESSSFVPKFLNVSHFFSTQTD